VSIVAFLYLIDHAARSLRPVAGVDRVSLDAQRVIQSLYPRSLAEEREASLGHSDPPLPSPSTTIAHDGASGVVLAVDTAGLVAAAERADYVIRLIPQVGEFVARGEMLFEVYGEREPSPGELQQAVAVGPARTLREDPAFAFRILVDVAVKALSPAVNDPTTAVQAMHQIHRLLRLVGTRDLSTGRVHDRRGRLRLISRTPDWEDFVSLAVTEIRLYGAGSIQVPRRLRAMLEKLIEVLPPGRAPALREQLSLLERSVQRAFEDLEDQRRADIPDVQGVGGAR
jgi:uncharacterized membrane protein